MMHEHVESGRAGNNDPVEEAVEGSFPASDPPAWTATRAGKPESPAAKNRRKLKEAAPPAHCEAVGLFANPSLAQRAADELLASGFDRVDIGPPHPQGNLGAGLGRAATASGSLGVCAALGALTAGAVAALLGPRGARYIVAAAAGGAIGAASAHTASQWARKQAGAAGWPSNGTWLRVRLKTPDEQKRALDIIERLGARMLHLNWAAER